MSNNLIEKLNNETFTNLVELKHLNFSHNKLSEIQFGTFSHQRKLKSLDLSSNQIKMLHANILPLQSGQTKFENETGLEAINLSNNQIRSLSSNICPTPLTHLKWFSIGNNQMRELIGFNATFIPMAIIIGFDRNKFNCSYLETFFESITWKHLDLISTRIECNSDIDDAKPNETNTFSTTKATTASVVMSTSKGNHSESMGSIDKIVSYSTTEYIENNSTEASKLVSTSTENSTSTKFAQTQEEKVDKIEPDHLKIIKNEDHTEDSSVSLRHAELNSMKQYFSVMMWIMGIGFCIIGLAFTWIFLQIRSNGKLDYGNVFFKKNETDLPNAVENNQYEVIGFDKK